MRMTLKRQSLPVLFSAVLLAACGGAGTDRVANAVPPVPPVASETGADLRAYMHGIESATGADGRVLVFFSSAGIPPRGPGDDGNWTHDVYVSTWSPSDATIGAPRIFIQRPEAQEPVSVAQTADGRIMVSFEDGWNTQYLVNQRYGVYDASLQPIAAYPLDVRNGGHSGHVAAVGDHFVAFYSEGWIQGGGVDNLGSGNGVYAKVYDSAGRARGDEIAIAADAREWWPMIAGSPRRALMIWQQFVPGETYANLRMALLDPQTGAVSGRQLLQSNVKYYTYKAAYVPAVDRFLVTGTTVGGSGFAYLIDNDGRKTATLACMPATVREGGIAVNGTAAYTPARDNRLLHLVLTPTSITLTAVQPSPIAWSYLGSVGLLRNASQIHWVSLSQTGLQEADFDVRDATAPTAADRCARTSRHGLRGAG